jgi:hypothetical protein
LRTRFRFVLRKWAKWRHAGPIRKASFFHGSLEILMSCSRQQSLDRTAQGHQGGLPNCRTTSRGIPTSSSSRSSKSLRSWRKRRRPSQAATACNQPVIEGPWSPRGQCRGGIPESNGNATCDAPSFTGVASAQRGAGSIELGKPCQQSINSLPCHRFPHESRRCRGISHRLTGLRRLRLRRGAKASRERPKNFVSRKAPSAIRSNRWRQYSASSCSAASASG